MFQNLKIGRPFGIDLYLHPTFWLLPLMVAISGLSYGLGEMVLDLAVLFAVFGCVALHELGHALAARGYGIRTRDIMLYPLGGVASLERIPRKALPEIAIALAGPAVNVVIALGLAFVLAAWNVGVMAGLSSTSVVDAFLTRLLAANVILVAFNLIPAFPMDGGRVFRALVSLLTDRVTATEIAVALGSIIAVLLGLLGLFTGQFMLLLVAISVFLMGRSELAIVRRQEQYRQPDPVTQPDGINGWEYDPRNGMWTEWQDGYPVRRVRR